MSNNPILSKLQWFKAKVGSDGFVTLVDVMGTDADILNAAKVSYGNDNREGSTALTIKDRELMNYLMRHQHMTPFEMVEVKFLVRVPMHVWRQWIRHRTANVNEYSTRYKEAIDSFETTQPDQWRLQSSNNKQGSDGYLSKEDGYNLTQEEKLVHNTLYNTYYDRLACGVAKEQARKDLPLSTYTEAYWKCDLRNIFNFLRLRLDSHAQLEIREFAYAIAEIIKCLFPVAWDAFNNYQLHAITLSVSEIRCIGCKAHPLDFFTNKREAEECLMKMERMNLPIPNSLQQELKKE